MYTDFGDFNHYLKNKLSAKPAFSAHTSPVITDPPIPSTIPQIAPVPTKIHHRIVVIDSRDRDTDRYPKANNFVVNSNVSSQFTVDDISVTNANVTPGFWTKPNEYTMAFAQPNANFEEDFRNVRNVKLEECIVPDFTALFPYLILRIPELQDVIGGTSNPLRTAFAILIPERVHGSYATCKTNINGICQKNFNPPLAKLTNLTLQLTDPTGALFPTDLETLTVLKIASEIPDKDAVFNYEIL